MGRGGAKLLDKMGVFILFCILFRDVAAFTKDLSQG